MGNIRNKGRAFRCLAAGFFAAVAATGVARAGETAGDAAVALTVNGVAIAVGVVESEYRWIFNQNQMFHPVNDAQIAKSRREAVDRVIVWELVRPKLVTDGKAVTPLELDAMVAGDRARIGDTFTKYIGILGQDEGSYRRRTEGIQNFKRYQKDYIAPGLKIGDEEIKAHYAKVATYQSPEAYRVRYLQVYSYDAGGRLIHSDLASVAARARQQVVEGAVLEDLAKELSTTQVTGRVANGYYEIGKWPLYETVLKTLVKSGDVSEVLKVTNNSYLIFRLEEKVPAKNISLTAARPEIERLLLDIKLNEEIPSHAAGLKKVATIKYVDPKYAPGK